MPFRVKHYTSTISTAEGGPVILLEDVIVARPYRGQGLGGLMMRHILNWAQSNGFLRVTLLMDRDNVEALRFYESNGFKRSGMVVLRQNLRTACQRDVENRDESET